MAYRCWVFSRVASEGIARAGNLNVVPANLADVSSMITLATNVIRGSGGGLGLTDPGEAGVVTLSRKVWRTPS